MSEGPREQCNKGRWLIVRFIIKERDDPDSLFSAAYINSGKVPLF